MGRFVICGISFRVEVAPYRCISRVESRHFKMVNTAQKADSDRDLVQFPHKNFRVFVGVLESGRVQRSDGHHFAACAIEGMTPFFIGVDHGSLFGS